MIDFGACGKCGEVAVEPEVEGRREPHGGLGSVQQPGAKSEIWVHSGCDILPIKFERETAAGIAPLMTMIRSSTGAQLNRSE